jgi:hypothetical protein
MVFCCHHPVFLARTFVDFVNWAELYWPSFILYNIHSITPSSVGSNNLD